MNKDLVKRSRSLVVEAGTKLAPDTFLRNAVHEMDREDLEKLAAAYLIMQLKNRARAVVLNVERESASNAQKPRWGTRKYERWAANPDNADEHERDRQLRAEYAAINAEAERGLVADMQKAIDRFKEEMRVEWNAELLNSEFARGDGTTVTWGDATLDDHHHRIAMHKKNATAGLEGAARHTAAVEAITQAGVTSLNELAKEAA